MGKQSKDDDYSQTQPLYFNNIFQSSLEVSLEFFGAEYISTQNIVFQNTDV